EGAQLEPAREDLAVLELVVAAGVGAPDGRAQERGAELADERAPEPEVRSRPAPERLAPRDVAAPEDGQALRSGVAGAREEDEVAVGVHGSERVVVDLRLEVRVGVVHLAARAAIGPDVGRGGRDVLLAPVELDAVDAVALDEGGDPVAPPGTRRGVGHVEDEARAADVSAVRGGGRAGGEEAQPLCLEAVVAGLGAALPGRAPGHDAVAAP